MDLGPLFFYNFEPTWKNSMPTYRDDPKEGGVQPDLQVFKSVLNTLLTSEEHRIVQGKAQKEADGLHTETLGDPARAAGSITM